MKNFQREAVLTVEAIAKVFVTEMNMDSTKAYIAGGSLLREDSPDIDLILYVEDLIADMETVAAKVSKMLGTPIKCKCKNERYGDDPGNENCYDYIFEMEWIDTKIDILVWDLERVNADRYENSKQPLTNIYEMVHAYFPFSIQNILYDFDSKAIWKGYSWSEEEIYVRPGIYETDECSKKYVKYYPYARFHFSEIGSRYCVPPGLYRDNAGPAL